jgi:hypothetical protein
MNLRGPEILPIATSLLIGLLISQPARSQSSCPLYWTGLTQGDRPVGRRGHTMAYDSARGRTVLFGGRDVLTASGSNELYGDTWEFDGYDWEQRFPAHSPPARFGAAMTYDAGRGVTVLFGGRLGLDGLTPNPTADVWEWDGNDWIKALSNGSGPLERYAHGLAYDSVRGVHVMFGGVAVEAISTNGVRYYALADTWEYDGAARHWTMRSEANLSAQVASLVFDAARNSTLLYGGDTGAPQTWLWNGAAGTWTQLAPPSSPRALREYAMAYDSERSITVVFGGTTSGGSTLSDTWEWDGSTWYNKSGFSGEPYFLCCPRNGAAMAFDSRLKQMVLFGGWGADLDTTWVLQPAIVFVDWQNSGTQTGSDSYPFRTVQQALDTLECGSIRVQPGDYVESPLTINKSIRLEPLKGAVSIR